MSDIISICRAAWNSSKREHQPDYDDLVESYRTMLTARAERVLAADAISEDAPFHPFEKGVLSQPKQPTTIDDIIPFKVEPLASDLAGSDQSAAPTETVDEMEVARKERAKRRVEATKPTKKTAAGKTIKVVKKAAKKVAHKK